MARKVVECVPNFSEGRDLEVVKAITEAIAQTGCSVLDVAPGASTHRTVFTFVGGPEVIVEGALAGARVARKHIDMRKHKGAHARFGALDVCPFVPVSGVTVEDCVALSRDFGARLAEELGVPVYLYEHAAPASADKAYRRSLAQIRSGEYEGLAERIERPEWKPDFGPASFVPEWGATVTGCRDFLIAYNVNLLGTKEQAHRIALNLREGGRGPAQPGRLKKVKGCGWYVDEFNLAQMSFNLDDFHVTPPHVVFEECVKDARELGLAVVGSELVGLIPLDAVLMAAEYYEQREGLFIVDRAQRIRLVIERLGLSSMRVFDPEKGIIELAMEAPPEPLLSGSLRAFVETMGARTAAPGGGSASAVMASMGAALGAMMGWMTYGSRRFENLDAQMRTLIGPLHKAMRDTLPLVDRDTQAFDAFMAASRLPKGTAELAATREAEMQKALKGAVDVPLEVMRLADGCWVHMAELAKLGNVNSRSDLFVGAKALLAGIEGAHSNVVINLDDVKDEAFVRAAREEAEAILARAHAGCDSVTSALAARVGGEAASAESPKKKRRGH